jgi:large subunit ribosomal protein L9e
MKDIYKDEEFDIPEGVSVNVKSRLVTVKGPRGELTKVYGTLIWKLKNRR